MLQARKRAISHDAGPHIWSCCRPSSDPDVLLASPISIDLARAESLDTIPSMPDDHAVQAWIRRNEAARAEDRRRDTERSMSERSKRQSASAVSPRS
jgi:hypothetical protein